MEMQLRRHCKLARHFGHLVSYISSSIWRCLNDLSPKLTLFEDQISTFTIALANCSLLNSSAGRQIFLMEISGRLTQGLALRAPSRTVMFSGRILLVLVLDGCLQQVWQDHAHVQRR
jgi:hypothetical protein